VRELVESYFAAERRRDVSGVLEHFNDDAVVVLPDGRRLVGRAAIGEFYVGVYAQLAELDVRVVSMLTDDGLAAVEWEAALIDHSGKTQTLRGVNVLRTRAGRFAELRTYFGPARG
jgi:uncharacterized protein (TIGR02246 family)